MGALPGVLLDRDGTLIRDVGYLKRIEEMEILPRAAEAIRLLSGRGFKVAVVTNQSGVGRGFLKEEDLEKIHRELRSRLVAEGAAVDAIYYCPHHPTEAAGSYRVACECRKPAAGLAERAAADLDLDLHRSYVVGDQATDMELAARIGATGIRIENRRPETEDGRVLPVSGLPSPVIVKDLWEAANWIIRDFRRQG
jgi:D-glycero-D-manno-heptose 1,7-bisphosphate phosphatase